MVWLGFTLPTRDLRTEHLRELQTLLGDDLMRSRGTLPKATTAINPKAESTAPVLTIELDDVYGRDGL